MRVGKPMDFGAMTDVGSGFITWAEGLKGGAAPMIGTIIGTLVGAVVGNLLAGLNLRVAETRRSQLEARNLQFALEAELIVQMRLLPEIAVTLGAFGTDPTPTNRRHASMWTPYMVLEQSVFAANAGKIGALPPQSARALIEFHAHLRDLSRLVGLASESDPKLDHMPIVFAMAKAVRTLEAGLACWRGMTRRRSSADRAFKAEIEKGIRDMSLFLAEVHIGPPTPPKA